MDHAQRKISASDNVPSVSFDEAVGYLKSKIPVTKNEWSDISEKVHFRAFIVSKIAEIDLTLAATNKVKDLLTSSIKDGKGILESWEDFKHIINTKALDIKPGYWENVYRTNTATAYTAGKLIQYQKTNPIAYELFIIDDERTSDICRHLLTKNGQCLIILSGSWFWKEYGFPPYHYQCRTGFRAIYKIQVGKDNVFPGNVSKRKLHGFKPMEGFGGNPIDKESWWKISASMLNRISELGIVDEVLSFAKQCGINAEFEDLVNDTWTFIKTGQDSGVYISSKRKEDSEINNNSKLKYNSDLMMAKTLAKESNENVYLISERHPYGKNPDCIFKGNYLEEKHVRGGIRAVGINAVDAISQASNVFLFLDNDFLIDSCINKIHGEYNQRKKNCLEKGKVFIEPKLNSEIIIFCKDKINIFKWIDIV